MADVSMPRLSDSMEEGTILKWLKSDGDSVSRGEELVEIETDKANMTYEADQDGTLSIVAQEGDTLTVGETIARIGEGAQPQADESPEADESSETEEGPQADEPSEAEEAPQAEGSSEADEPSEADEAPQAEESSEADESPQADESPAEDEAGDGGEESPEPAPQPAASNGDAGGRVKASPIARRMAREAGVELGELQGSGPGGRIVKADVEAVAKASDGQRAAEPAPEPQAAPAEAPQEEREAEPAVPGPVASKQSQESGRGEVQTQDLTRLQQTIARRMAESKATAPEFVLHADVDMDDAVELRKQLKAAAGDDAVSPSFNDLVIKAAALALRDFPRANGAYRDGHFELYSRVNVGVAVAARDALVVPTIFDADRKSLGQIARESRAIAERVRAGEITPPELSGGTFSVSNLGMYGIHSFVPVINPPQAAILGVGAMEPTAVVADGEVQVRTRMRLTLVCDHRILYGADAAEFLGRIRERLEQPLALAL
jgi:pyruvate dehydrogenase E2 component (dihydrolipoamide acetyltransferase)